MLGMVLKGYPRISESFISTEILLLEQLGIPMEIYSLRQPRENFSHDHVRKIKASVTYLPEYVIPHWQTLLRSNKVLYESLGKHYLRCFSRACARAFERKKPATVRHFLQAGHLAAARLVGSEVKHLHAHFCHTPTSVAFFASELTGIPFSFTAHAKDIYTSERSQLARKLQHARFAVTCTRYNADYIENIRREYDLSTLVHVVYHGIDLDFFRYSPPPRPVPPYRILSIGRLVPKKGYDDLLQALKLLDASGVDFQFTHVGSGEMKDEIRRLVKDMGLERRVALLGTLPHQAVLEHYQSSHCFALACKVASNGDRDGIPNVIVEAMAVGLPVISTDVSAIPELVENEVTGRLVEPQRPGLMARAIKRALTDDRGNETMTRTARRRVEDLFDNRKNVERLADLHRAALGMPSAT